MIVAPITLTFVTDTFTFSMPIASIDPNPSLLPNKFAKPKGNLLGVPKVTLLGEPLGILRGDPSGSFP